MHDSPRVILDTNILIGAAYSPTSASRRLVDACLSGELTAYLSPALRKEYEFIIDRAIHVRGYDEQLQRWLKTAREVQLDESPPAVTQDPDDDKFVAAALAAEATLISNDRHLLAVDGHQGLRVIRSGQAKDEFLSR